MLVLPIIEKSVFLKMHEELQAELSVFHNKKRLKLLDRDL